MHFLSVQLIWFRLEFVADVNKKLALSLKQEKWSYMGFLRVSSDKLCWSDSTLTWQGGDKRKRRGKRGGGGGDYSREAIISNISV